MNEAFYYRLGQKRGGGSGGGSSDEWIGDGNTHIWISLSEGRTSPMMGLNLNGTVTVDWGDGTEPEVLTGTSTSTTVWTSTHNYAAAGTYMITLVVDGKCMFIGDSDSYVGPALLRYSGSSDGRNMAYRSAICKVEFGNGAQADSYSFYNCYLLTSAAFSGSNYFTGTGVFRNAVSLRNVLIPEGVTEIGTYAFEACRSLAMVVFPASVTNIYMSAFNNCMGARLYDFTACVAVPALSSTNVFNKIPDDCEIRVPASLVDEWKAATNWSTYAGYIVGV